MMYGVHLERYFFPKCECSESISVSQKIAHSLALLLRCLCFCYLNRDIEFSI